MIADVRDRQRLEQALTRYAAAWYYEPPPELENLFTFAIPPRRLEWQVLLAATESDYLSAALYIDADLHPSGTPTNSSGRLGWALRQWWHATTLSNNDSHRSLRLYLFATMPPPYGPESVSSAALSSQQLQRLARVVEAITPDDR